MEEQADKIPAQKHIALIAHDGMKNDLKAYQRVLPTFQFQNKQV